MVKATTMGAQMATTTIMEVDMDTYSNHQKQKNGEKRKKVQLARRDIIKKQSENVGLQRVFVSWDKKIDLKKRKKK